MTDLKKLLEEALAGIIDVPPPNHMLVGDEATEWLPRHGVVRGKITTANGAATGFSRQGMAAVVELADALRTCDAKYLRFTDARKFFDQVADIILAERRAGSFSADSSSNLLAVQAEAASWYAATAISRTFFIPSAIIPYPAKSFSIGPVSFIHASDFVVQENIATDTLKHMQFEHFLKSMQEHAAFWVAEIEVKDRDEERAGTVANLAVDVALTAVQLIVPLPQSRDMARITGRTNPPWIGSVYRAGTRIYSGTTRQDPGFAFHGSALDDVVSTHTALLQSAGRRLDAFVNGGNVLPELNQAWSDAAFWFHEGIADRLETVAVAKLETSLEVLLCAESTKGSAKRIKDGFAAFYGLKEDDLISPKSAITVKEFVKKLVGARSQVLHGTFSTLSVLERMPRAELEALAWDFLRRSTGYLDAYASSSGAKDDIDAFLTWVTANRTPATKAA